MRDRLCMLRILRCGTRGCIALWVDSGQGRTQFPLPQPQLVCGAPGEKTISPRRPCSQSRSPLRIQQGLQAGSPGQRQDP